MAWHGPARKSKNSSCLKLAKRRQDGWRVSLPDPSSVLSLPPRCGRRQNVVFCGCYETLHRPHLSGMDQSRFAETLTATLTLNPNFGKSGFGESGRHQPLKAVSHWRECSRRVFAANTRREWPFTLTRVK